MLLSLLLQLLFCRKKILLHSCRFKPCELCDLDLFEGGSETLSGLLIIGQIRIPHGPAHSSPRTHGREALEQCTVQQTADVGHAKLMINCVPACLSADSAAL